MTLAQFEQSMAALANERPLFYSEANRWAFFAGRRLGSADATAARAAASARNCRGR
jgi:hypothetical protein